jgi:DNA-binding transcriptional ArsR family regulator
MSDVDVPITPGPDPKALALSEPARERVQAPLVRGSERKLYKRFLKGPIPLGWLTRAATLHGRALHVAIAIWFRAGMEGPTGLRVSNTLAAEFGVDRHAKNRAVRSLEDAGLISVTRECGRSPVVDLIAVDAMP